MANDYLFKNERKDNVSFLTYQEEYQEERQETYSIIIKNLMLKHNRRYLNELNNRIFLNENINDILIDFINREEESVDTFIWQLKDKLVEYSENDLFSKFLI
jgi:hypothetical protein